MSQQNLVKLKCSKTGHVRFTTRKRKKDAAKEKKLELKKYNPLLRKYTVYKEVKK